MCKNVVMYELSAFVIVANGQKIIKLKNEENLDGDFLLLILWDPQRPAVSW